MLTRPYERSFRRAYEIWPASAWTAAAVALAVLDGPRVLRAPMAVFAVAMSVARMWQALGVLALRAPLSGRAMQVLPFEQMVQLTPDPDQLFLGFGFEWQPVHAQRLIDVAKDDYTKLLVPKWAIGLFRPSSEIKPDAQAGLPYLHGVERDEIPLYRALANFEGGTLIVGAPQSGKGVALGMLVTQAIRRGDVVLVIDPKNSARLRGVVQRACRQFRSADTFLSFHPAFPETGVRLDFTFNWQKPTEIASRIQAIMPPDVGGAFSSFGWDAVNVVVCGLIENEQRPNLALLTRYIERGVEPLLEESLRRFYENTIGPHWRRQPDMARLLQRAARGELRAPTSAATAELMALVEYYEKRVGAVSGSKSIDAQVRVFRHDREHYQKITANLLPILSMLTSGDLGLTLSPDAFDADDARPIMNYEKMERGGHVLYLCLDSLPDPSVARAIAGLALADLAARAGVRYNLGVGPRISLFVDEVSNVINRPLIEILNKGSEGRIWSTLAMQTVNDMAFVMGSVEAALMVLGNLQNMMVFRTRDMQTQQWLSEEFGETHVHDVRVAMSEGMDTHIGDFGVGNAAMVAETAAPLVPPAMFGRLPNLEYFASVSGGHIYKGRVAILDTGMPDPECAS
ncbi:conjugative transfer system coupling protein TraD [Rugamonas aquatica]|uniref:Conjugative transfer system coupling protein TraD n=1 Tax=Rugamonas aquatica TaxID=2743357 RepID=A0A6A7N671_9BURK|nr:conjugative transfer system coupling protein TraD [Rugamonas aquatica]MQA40625.1 conjugative transfer system coupling protein TraD [Rugamonas aquatica]